MPPVGSTALDDGGLGLPRKGAKQPVTRSQSLIDGAKPDQQHDLIDRPNVVHMIGNILHWTLTDIGCKRIITYRSFDSA